MAESDLEPHFLRQLISVFGMVLCRYALFDRLSAVIDKSSVFPVRRKAICCQVRPSISPLNLSPVNTLSSKRHVLVRSLTAILRWINIWLKFSPCIIFYPLALISDYGNQLWWRYTIYALNSSGPTVIKFAQWAATRRDIFNADVISRLSQLHTRVTPLPFSKIEPAVARSLGENWSETITIDGLIGSGSIAQVYRGTLVGSGQDVAIKVCRDGVHDSIETDIDILRCLAWVSDKLPVLHALKSSAAVEAFSEFLVAQTDLRTEARNLEKFQENFTNSKSVRFPRVHFASEEVLIESFEDGILLTDLLADPELSKYHKLACEKGTSAFLKMLFDDNFVHGDLHPGNILFNSTNETLTFLDCGLVSTLEPRDYRNFADLFSAIATGRASDVGRLMIERSRGSITDVKDPDGFCLGVEELVVATSKQREGFSLKGLQLGNLFRSLLGLACTHGVELESNFVATCCSLIVLDGVGKALDPDRDILAAATPYLLRVR